MQKWYRVVRAFGTYSVGEWVAPVGLQRDRLIVYGFVHKVPVIQAARPARGYMPDAEPAPAPEAEPEPVVVEVEDEPEDAPIEEATEPEPETATLDNKRGRGKGRKWN